MLDVGAPIIFDTDVLGYSRSGERGGGTAVAGGGAGLLNREDAVMEVLYAALANVAVGIFSGADSVDGVDEPFSTSSHLKAQDV